MPEDRSVLKVISWRDICPWFLIFRSLAISLSVPMLLVATIGVALMHLGSLASEEMFGTSSLSLFETAVENPGDEELVRSRHTPDFTMRNPTNIALHLSLPFQSLFDFQRVSAGKFTFQTVAALLFSGLWSIIVWAFLGSIISRIAVVRLATGQRIGLREAFGHAKKKLLAHCAAPLMPMLGMLILSLPIIILGLLLRAQVSTTLVGILWPFALVAGFLMALLAIGVLFGWPLMWATISSEGSDAFDALSRAFAYTFQRPLNYLFYGIVAGSLGALSWEFVSHGVELIVSLTSWAAALGTGPGETPLTSNTGLINFWNNCVRAVAIGFGYSYFWTATGAIYLLLRRDVDQKELDEVYFADLPAGASSESTSTTGDSGEEKSS